MPDLVHELQRQWPLPGREREWSLLNSFLADPSATTRLGVVSGRRRHGKSYMLRALCESVGGLCFTAISEEGRPGALRRFGEATAAYADLAPEALRPRDWREALSHARDVTTRRSAPSLLVIDDLPHLLQHSYEIPGLIHDLLSKPGTGWSTRLILAGSTTHVAHEPPYGTQSLRERAIMDLRLSAFDYRTSRDFWQIADPHTALRVHAVLGGAPGYRAIAGSPAPNDSFDSWVTRTLLNPGRAIHSRTETEYLLPEGLRTARRTLYCRLLSAIARGASTPTKIGAALGLPPNAITRPLDVLESTGYVNREQDILRPRQRLITLADPVIRFNQLITLPQASAVEEGFADEAWKASTPTFNSKILGPHFEELARTWTRRYAHAVLPDGLPGPVGTTEAPDPAARTRHEVDVIALALGERPQSPRARIALLGEATATVARSGVGDLQRLERIRDLLTEQGYDTSGVTLALFSLYGFHRDLHDAAARLRDLLLIDLDTLYGTDRSAHGTTP